MLSNSQSTLCKISQYFLPTSLWGRYYDYAYFTDKDIKAWFSITCPTYMTHPKLPSQREREMTWSEPSAFRAPALSINQSVSLISSVASCQSCSFCAITPLLIWEESQILFYSILSLLSSGSLVMFWNTSAPLFPYCRKWISSSQ